MRIVEIDGAAYEIRGLKYGELRSLRKDGLDLHDLPATKYGVAMDRVFELVLTDSQLAELDSVANQEMLKVWNAVMRETFGSPGEEKNSSPSGNGSQTAAE